MRHHPRSSCNRVETRTAGPALSLQDSALCLGAQSMEYGVVRQWCRAFARGPRQAVLSGCMIEAGEPIPWGRARGLLFGPIGMHTVCGGGSRLEAVPLVTGGDGRLGRRHSGSMVPWALGATQRSCLRRRFVTSANVQDPGGCAGAVLAQVYQGVGLAADRDPARRLQAHFGIAWRTRTVGALQATLRNRRRCRRFAFGGKRMR